jgi:hypothetical protein
VTRRPGGFRDRESHPTARLVREVADRIDVLARRTRRDEDLQTLARTLRGFPGHAVKTVAGIPR